MSKIQYLKDYFDDKDSQFFYGEELRHNNRYSKRTGKQLENIQEGGKKSIPLKKEIMKKKWDSYSEEYKNSHFKKIEEGLNRSGKSRYITGKYYSNKNTTDINFQSSYELLALTKLEKDSTVLKYGRCSFSIPYVYEGRGHRYFPDFLVEHIDGEFSVIEVKSEHMLRDIKTLEKIRVGQEYCKDNNMTYILWGIKDLIPMDKVETNVT